MTIGPFVTNEELVEYFGENEVRLAVTGGAIGSPVDLSEPEWQTRITAALEDASGLISTYIDVTKVDSSVLSNWCRDIAFYKLGRKPKNVTEETRKRYEDAMEQIKLAGQVQRADAREDRAISASGKSYTLTSGENEWSV
jgi:phage gp36-like protein